MNKTLRPPVRNEGFWGNRRNPVPPFRRDVTMRLERRNGRETVQRNGEQTCTFGVIEK
jgi:hypothetical protein